jgi:serine/threonine protein kinase
MEYGHEIDWWALGIMMYEMLTGSLPFDDADEYVLRAKIKRHQVEYPQEISKAAEGIMRKVSFINSKIEALEYRRIGLLYALLFPRHVLF